MFKRMNETRLRIALYDMIALPYLYFGRFLSHQLSPLIVSFTLHLCQRLVIRRKRISILMLQNFGNLKSSDAIFSRLF